MSEKPDPKGNAQIILFSILHSVFGCVQKKEGGGAKGKKNADYKSLRKGLKYQLVLLSISN